MDRPDVQRRDGRPGRPAAPRASLRGVAALRARGPARLDSPSALAGAFALVIASVLDMAGASAQPASGPGAARSIDPATTASIATAAPAAPVAPVAPVPAARTGAQRVDAVEVELVAERVAVRADGRIDLGLRIRHDPHWHTYWRNPGDSGLATQVEPSGPAGTRFDPVRWPAPQRIWVGPLANYGYEGEIVLPFTAHLPTPATGTKARFEASAQWLVCKDVCVPGEARLAIELPVAAAGAAEPARGPRAALFDAMAAATPDPARALAGSLHRDGARMSLSFPTPPDATGVARAEFFPYPEAVVSAPAPQALSRTDRGWRLDLAAADGADVPASMEGLLVVDGRAHELRAAAATGMAPEGVPVSVAQQPAGLSRAGGGLLGSGRAAPGVAAAPGIGAAGTDRGADGAPVGAGLALALLFGVLGGLVLNLMPCVFPVVGLKVIGFAQAAGDAHGAHRAMRRGAAAFAAGVLVSFWVLAGLMLVLRAAGESIGWGFQLQSPGFVAAMALLFVAVGLNFSGVFEFGLSLTRLGNVGGASTAGSFGSGVLAVLVATPCTAPFMGSALGFTLAQPAAVTMAVFTAIGVGMALPYVLLGLFPAWVRALPKPGRWMQTLREVLAFPMYATAAWLAWVLVQQAGADAMLRLLLAAVSLGAGAWAWGRWANGAPRRPVLAACLAIAGTAAAGALLAPILDASPLPVATAPADAGPPADGAVAWGTWSEARVAKAVEEGRPVFVDFTAAWCVSCQANKKLVLERGTVAAAMRERGVVALRADWTQRDPAITAALAAHGRNGVPLYLVYRPGEPRPRVLPELLTSAIVVDALR